MPAPNWNSPLGTSWSNTSFNPLGGAVGHRPSVANNRPRAVRLAVCNACRALGPDYHDVAQLHMDLDPRPSLSEIADICETEGDALNGGGTLLLRRSGPSAFSVRFEPDEPRPHGLGEIGSPVPGNSMPAGFGQRGGGGYGAIGGLASPGGF